MNLEEEMNHKKLSRMRTYYYIKNEIEYDTIEKSCDWIKYKDAIQIAKEYAEERCIHFLESIRDYEHESGTIIHQDERTSKELFDIFNAPLATDAENSAPENAQQEKTGQDEQSAGQNEKLA